MPTLIGALWGKLRDVLKQARKNISGMLALAVAVQTLRSVGHLVKGLFV